MVHIRMVRELPAKQLIALAICEFESRVHRLHIKLALLCTSKMRIKMWIVRNTDATVWFDSL